MGLSAAGYAQLALAAASAGTEYVNTQNTLRRQDKAAAQSIADQAKFQKKANADVNATVQKVSGSNAAAARAQRLGDYMQALARNRDDLEAGQTPGVGSSAFKSASANALAQSQNYAQQAAGQLASIDAPTIQRQQEGFDYGRLATSLGLIGNQAQGQQFLDNLRLNGIRRNAGLDLLAGLMSAGSNAFGGAHPTAQAQAAGSDAGVFGSGGFFGGTYYPGGQGQANASDFMNKLRAFGK